MAPVTTAMSVLGEGPRGAGAGSSWLPFNPGPHFPHPRSPWSRRGGQSWSLPPSGKVKGDMDATEKPRARLGTRQGPQPTHRPVYDTHGHQHAQTHSALWPMQTQDTVHIRLNMDTDMSGTHRNVHSETQDYSTRHIHGKCTPVWGRCTHCLWPR